MAKAEKTIEYALQDSLIKCMSCNSEYTPQATTDKITIDICSNCHPFYTGKQKLVDTAGRVDRYKAKLKKAEEKAVSKPATKTESVKDIEVKKTEKSAKKSDLSEI